MTTEFFMPMQPPTTTHQQKKVAVQNGKPVFYEPPELEKARMKLTAHLSKHVLEKPYDDAVRLLTKWCFPIAGKHIDGEYKITKPDTDNMIKLLKDCMTDLNFWTDDAIVASEITEKFWADIPGIYVKIESLEIVNITDTCDLYKSELVRKCEVDKEITDCLVCDNLHCSDHNYNISDEDYNKRVERFL